MSLISEPPWHTKRSSYGKTRKGEKNNLGELHGDWCLNNDLLDVFE